MINDLLILGGYGQYVWPAFIFTFLCCFSLYLKTRMELKKNEKIFIREFSRLPDAEFKVIKSKKMPRKACLESTY